MSDFENKIDLEKFYEHSHTAEPVKFTGIEERDPTGQSPHDPGAKLDEGKLLAEVIADFGRALEGVAAIGTHGVEKYSRRSWLEVPNGRQRYLDAAWRHLLRYAENPTDLDSGLDHLDHAIWNLLAAQTLKKKLDLEVLSKYNG